MDDLMSPFAPTPSEQAYAEPMPVAPPSPEMGPDTDVTPWSEKLKMALLLAAGLGMPGLGSKVGKMGYGALGGLMIGSGAAEARGRKKSANAAPDAASGQPWAVSSGEMPQAPQPTGNPAVDALQGQIFNLQVQRYEEYNGISKSGTTGKRGDGPATNALDKRINDLTQQLIQVQGQVTPQQQLDMDRQKSEAEAAAQARADERAAEGRGWLYGGAGVGAAGGAALSGLAAYLTRGRSRGFNKVAGELGEMTNAARKSRFDDMGMADEAAGLVDEANSLRGKPKPFGVEPEKYAGRYSDEAIARQADEGAAGPFAKITGKEGRATANAVQGSRKAAHGDLGDTFEKPMSLSTGTEWALPTVGAVDFGVNQARAEMADNPEDKHAAQNLANFGLGMMGGSKGARLLTKPFTPMASKVEAGAAAKVDAARNKLTREIDAVRPETAKPAAARFVPAKGGPALNGTQGASAKQLQKFKQQAVQNRNVLLSNANHDGLNTAITNVRNAGRNVNANTVMRELKKLYPAGRIDGVKINKKEIGSWLSRHGYLP